ncbi:MAG: pyridoxal phosphate-dependent aminotransferase [Clostridia bacterium]|nr:pyridoxal phosphate-dependent aminotransferase [Clostridia bacterium]
MFNKTMQRLGEERSVIREIFEYANKRKQEIGEKNVFDFSLGNPSAPPPPCVEEEILRLAGVAAAHGYTSAPGAPEVRRAIAQYIRSEFGVPMSEDLVYMTCGAAASLVITLSAILREGDEVLVPVPFFPEYRVFVTQAAGTLVPVSTDAAFHLDLAAIEAAITKKTKIVLLNSPNNPTGAVYEEEEMRALGALLAKKNAERSEPLFLVVDEPYRELCYGDPPVYPMAVYANTVVLYSFSKSLSLAGERIGYVAVSPHCAQAESLFAAICGAARYHGYVCAPSLFQRVAAKCLGASSDIELYRTNRNLLYGALSGMGYSCIVPEGAFYLFVRALEKDAKRFCERAKEHELLLVPSDSFGVEGFVRISYCVPREVVENSIAAFKKLFEAYRRT